MHAKLSAAVDAIGKGVREILIAPGADPGIVTRALAGAACGTRLIAGEINVRGE
jgi:acetylglutamate kinase